MIEVIKIGERSFQVNLDEGMTDALSAIAGCSRSYESVINTILSDALLDWNIAAKFYYDLEGDIPF